MDGKVYVGNLPDDVRSNDLEDIFYKYGRLRNVDIKHGGGRGPPFAFLEFEDMRLVVVVTVKFLNQFIHSNS